MRIHYSLIQCLSFSCGICFCSSNRVQTVDLQQAVAHASQNSAITTDDDRVDRILELLEVVDPTHVPALRQAADVVKEFGLLRSSLRCEDREHCVPTGVDAVQVAQRVLTFASKVCAVVPGAQIAVPILESLNALLMQTSASDPPMTLDSMVETITDRIDKSVRDMQSFHVERDIADAQVQAILVSDVKAMLPHRVCSETLLSQIYAADMEASQAMSALLQRAGPLNKNPLVKQLVDGEVDKSCQMLDVIVLVETYYKAWHIVAISRFEMLTSAMSKYQQCFESDNAAGMSKEMLKSAFEELEAQLNIVLLDRAASRFHNSHARRAWQGSRVAIADRVVPYFEKQVVIEGRWSEYCDIDKFAEWVYLSHNSRLALLVKFVPERCDSVHKAVDRVVEKCIATVDSESALLYRGIGPFRAEIANLCAGWQLTG